MSTESEKHQHHSPEKRELRIDAASSFSNTDTLPEKWQRCLKLIYEALPGERAGQTLKTWFEPIQPLQWVDNILFLNVESQFFGEWLESHYKSVLTGAVRAVFGDQTRIEYKVTSPQKSESARSEAQPPAEAAEKTGALTRLSKDPGDATRRTIGAHRPDRRFTFGNYYANGLNRFAMKAAEHVSENPAEALYNPIYFHGDVGTGKSHLLHAIGNGLLENYDDVRVVYLTAESFVHSYIKAVQAQAINKFIAAFRQLDALLLDNLHFLAGKTKSQEALLLILQDMLHRGKQVAFCANVPPNLLTQFHPGIVALIQHGLIADLHQTDVVTREQIIDHYLKSNRIELETAAVQYLAKQLGQNIHHLHSVMVRIVTQISLLGKPLSLEEIKYIVAHLCPGDANDIPEAVRRMQRAISIPDIIKAVSQYFDVPKDAIQGISRKQRVSRARQVAVYLCRALTDESLSAIGYHFSGIHHTSVRYAVENIEKQIQDNPRLRMTVEKIRALL